MLDDIIQPHLAQYIEKRTTDTLGVRLPDLQPTGPQDFIRLFVIRLVIFWTCQRYRLL